MNGLLRTCLLGVSVFVGVTSTDVAADRRVVDVVDVGSPSSEAAHGYAAYNDTLDVFNGTPVRRTRGWLHYTLTTFDDTAVTIACTFVGTASGSYDLLVEDRVVATGHDEGGGGSRVQEIDVPFAITKGKSSIVVVLRGRDGQTPALRQLRTIQDHNEVAPLYARPSFSHSGVFR